MSLRYTLSSHIYAQQCKMLQTASHQQKDMHCTCSATCKERAGCLVKLLLLYCSHWLANVDSLRPVFAAHGACMYMQQLHSVLLDDAWHCPCCSRNKLMVTGHDAAD